MADVQEQMQALVDGLCALDHDSAVTVLTSVLQARPELAPPVVTFAVPDLTYPPSKALIERRAEGTVKSFNESKGFGFIECQELFATFGNDVFLHHSQLGGFTVGQPVSFAVMLSKENRPQAYDLQPAGSGKGAMMAMGKGMAKGLFKMAAGAMPCGGGCGGGGMLGPGAKGMARGCMGGGFLAKGFGKGDDGLKRKGNRLNATLTDDAEALGSYAGVIKSFNQNNGYGFIDCSELKEVYGNDTFLHHADLGSCQVGDTVVFTAFLNTAGKPQARGLEVTGAPAKRART